MLKSLRLVSTCTALVLLLPVAGVHAAVPPPFALLRTFADPGVGPQVEAYQGHSVAVDGGIVAVGVPSDDVGGTDSGQVKTYQAASGALWLTLPNPSPAAGDSFGWAVSVSGMTVVVGCPGDDTGAPDAGAVYVFDLASETPRVPILTLTNPSPSVEGRFGYAVAISGTRIVVGAHLHDVETITNAGIAYVYDLGSATPAVPVLTLPNPSPVAEDWFGHAVAIEGSRVVIGATGDNTAGGYQVGAAYVYDLLGPIPSEPVAILLSPSPANFDNFGFSVGISGAHMVVGAIGGSTGAPSAGAAYVFELTALGLNPFVTVLTNPAPAFLDFFGWSVAISGTRVVVGAVWDASADFQAGSVYVFDLTNASPTRPSWTLPNPSPESRDEFGCAVAIAGSRMVVGARGDDSRSENGGSSYLYDLSSATPGLPVTLASPSPAAGDRFGSATAISGTRIVIGAPGDTHGAYASGSAYVYDLAQATSGVPLLTLTNPFPIRGGVFGWSVAISGPRIVIGAGDAGAAGVAHVYDLRSATPAVPVVTFRNPSPEVNDWFSTSVAISGDWVVVGAPGDNAGQGNSGSVYVFDLTGATTNTAPFLTLTNPAPASDDAFGHAVAISGPRIVVGAHGDDFPASETGRAYVYDLASANPRVPTHTLQKPAPNGFDNFGWAVAISGSHVVVGANKVDLGVFDVGSAYVFDLGSATPTLPQFTLTHPNPGATNSFGSAVAISGQWVVVGADRQDAGVSDAGSVCVFDLSGLTPQIPVAILTRPTPMADDYFGAAVAMEGNTVVVGAPFVDGISPDRGAAYVFGVVPALSLVLSTPGMATLSWAPANSPGFVLQYADRLSPTNWLNAASGSMNPVTIPTTGAARFYRLAQP